MSRAWIGVLGRTLGEGKETTEIPLESGTLLAIEQDERRLGREKRFLRRSVRGGLGVGSVALMSSVWPSDDCPVEDDCLESGEVGLSGGVSSSCGIIERTRNLVSRCYEYHPG